MTLVHEGTHAVDNDSQWRKDYEEETGFFGRMLGGLARVIFGNGTDKGYGVSEINARINEQRLLDLTNIGDENPVGNYRLEDTDKVPYSLNIDSDTMKMYRFYEPSIPKWVGVAQYLNAKANNEGIFGSYSQCDFEEYRLFIEKQRDKNQ